MDAQAQYMYQRNPNDGPNPQRPTPNNGNGNNGGPPRNPVTTIMVRLLIFLGIVLLGWYLIQFFTSGNNSSNPNAIEIPYSTFYSEVTAGNVKDVTFTGQDANGDFTRSITITDVNGTSKTGTTFHFTQLPNGDPNLTKLLNDNHVSYQAKAASDNSLWFSILINFLPWILVIGIFFFIARRATQGQQNIFSFGKSRAKVVLEDRPSTTFADVAGVDEAKNDLVEVVEFLKTPGKFQKLGGRIPRGVLLVGPPGTGKTLLARAVAGEAGVPFFSISGSEFVEVLVGVGASRVRDLFDQAKKASPSIIFIDEIDAVGPSVGPASIATTSANKRSTSCW